MKTNGQLEINAEAVAGAVMPRRSRRSSVRSNHTLDLGKAEQIMSQGEISDVEDECAAKRVLAVTPRHNSSKLEVGENINATENTFLAAATPRRSTRKSVKPMQDYEEIVSRKREFRSSSKSKSDDTDDATVVLQPKWTPAKVGRVSQKRGRRSRRTGGDKSKKKEIISSSENEDVQEKVTTIIKSDSEDKENEEPKEIGNVKVDEDTQIMDNTQTKKEEKLVYLDNSCCLETKGLHMSDLGLKFIDDSDSMEEKPECKTVELSIADKSCVIEAKGSPQSVLEKLHNTLNASDCMEEKPKCNKTEGVGAASEQLLVGGENSDVETKEAQFVQDEPQFVQDEPQFVQDEPQFIQEKPQSVQEETLNDTFNASDCIIVSSEVCDDLEDEENMQPLQISDDECIELSSPTHKAPRIILTAENEHQETIFSTSTCENTPKRLSKASSRLPTPYKPKENVDYELEGDMEMEEVEFSVPNIAVEAIEPKESVLRSIRKRSISICIGEASDKLRAKSKNVTFYSPANQTMILEAPNAVAVAVAVKTSTKQTLPRLKVAQNQSFVTERRRRSKSFDESLLHKPIKPTKLAITPKKACSTPQKPLLARSKLPNFAAIHQKHFENMENLVDHVNRKKERAKVLINSALKTHQVSAKKVLPQNNQQLAITPKKEKPKAFKKINLDVLTTKSTNEIHDISTKSINVSHSTTTAADNRAIPELKLPNKRLPNPRLGIFNPVIVNATKVKQKQPTPGKNLPQTREAPLRPAFNLSTAMPTQNVKKPTLQGPAMSNVSSTTVGLPKPTASLNDKLATRRQRHVGMFKGRADSERAATSRADRQIIRGVRSNRRFDLQMQHRFNIEQ